MRTPPERDVNQLFDNADSFGMVFDAAWKRHGEEKPDHGLSNPEKLELILGQLASHPFRLSQPDLARQVAEFRLRLLGL